MRLSMWIIADLLKEYEPIVDIRNGDCILRNVRILSDNTTISRSTVYLSPISEDEILCSNEKDIIICKSRDIIEIFNILMDAFEEYDEWDLRLQDMIEDNCSLNDLLVEGAKRFSRYFFCADATFYIYEHAGDSKIIDQKQPFVYAMQHHMLPVETLIEINQQKHIRRPNQKSYYVAIENNTLISIVSNIFVADKHNGWLISLSEKASSYTKGDCDLQDQFGDRINQWMLHNNSMQLQLEKNDFICQMIEGTTDDLHGVERLQTFGWSPSCRKQIFLVKKMNYQLETDFIIDQIMSRLFCTEFVVHYQDRIVILANLDLGLGADYEKKFQIELKKLGYIGSCSPVFHKIHHLRNNYFAADVSLYYAQQNNLVSATFDDAIVPYIRYVISEHSVVNVTHPALYTLKQYDQMNHTQLLETLEAFLKNNCSYADTLKELFIHRSTLLYRMERIVALTGIDLDQYQTRLHLQLSFLVGVK